MNTAEEQLWEYIDGAGDEAFRQAIARKIKEDKDYGNLYANLLLVEQQLQHITLEEPSMSFSRNVMELIQAEPAPVSLKTKTDRRIILGISIFFLVIIATIFGYAISRSHITLNTLPSIKFQIDFNQLLSPILLKGFLFIDLVIGLLYADRLFRKKGMS